MTIQQWLHHAKQSLLRVTDCPALEAELLLAHVLNQPRSYLYTRSDEPLMPDTAAAYLQYVKRRSVERVPVSYLTGQRSFWSLDLHVSPDTLIPRPETELLVETALNLFPQEHIVMADIGTGSGAIALALASERPNWQIYATDISENALAMAKNNALKHALSSISFLHGNWCSVLPAVEFDLIISNPPYLSAAEWAVYADGLSHEPKQALVAEKDGLGAIEEITKTAKNRLRRGGCLLLEHGYLQGQHVRELLEKKGYESIMTHLDLAGHERATLGRLPF